MGSHEPLLTHKMPRLCPDFWPVAPHSHIHTRPGIEAAAARARHLHNIWRHVASHTRPTRGLDYIFMKP